MDFKNNPIRDHDHHESIINIDRYYFRSDQQSTCPKRVATHRGWTENRRMTQCFRKDTKLNAVLLSNVQLQKQLEQTDKCASCDEARDSKTVYGDMMVPTIKRHREGNYKRNECKEVMSSQVLQITSHLVGLTLNIYGDKTRWLTTQLTHSPSNCTRDSEHRSRE